MNFSRFSVLAVFLMMVLSAFVAVPNQYVGGEHEEGTEHGAYFVYIMTTDRSDAITEATPFTLDFPAPPMADNAPYELELICEGDDEGFIDGIYGTWVTSEGGNAGDFNNITSWEVWNTNGIQLEKFAYNPMSDIIDFEHPMVVFEDNESSGGGHLPAEVFDQEEFYCPEGTMPVHDHSDSDDIWEDFYQQNITVEMVSLNEWNVTVENLLNFEASNQLRSEIAQMCAAALGTDEGSVTSECFDYFLEFMDGEHGDHHMSGCSPEWGLNETECETFMEECDDGVSSMGCFYIMYELCVATDDGGEMCDDFGDDGDHDHDDSDEHHHHGDGDEHHDHDGDDDHTHEESDRHHNHDGPDMFSFMMSVIGYDMGYEDSSNVVNAVDELMGGFTLHHDIDDIAHYDVYHFNVTEEEVANYTVDISGEYDEETDQYFSPSYVYLYEGIHDVPSGAEEFEGNQRICEYADASEMYVDCYHILSTHLEVGSYSMFITNSCSHVWTYNESSEGHEFDGYECQYGSYNLSVNNDDNDTHVDNIVGNISNLDSIFTLEESHEIHREVSEEFAFFPFYETHTYTVTGDDNVSQFYSEQDVDHNQTMIVWLYAGSFTETDWSENLLYVSSGYENYNGSGDYNFSSFDLSELNEHPGDYVFVTTGQHTHLGGTYEAHIWSDDGTILDSWSGELCGDYQYTCEDTTEADDRAYFTFAHHYYYQENVDEGDDDGGLWDMFFMSIAENMSAYDDGAISEEEFADLIVDLLYEMAEMGAFEGDGGAPSPEDALEATDANGDGYMSFEEFQEHWEAQNDTADLDWDDVESLFADADIDDDDLLEIDELQYFIDGIEDMTSGYGDGSDVGDCPFDNVAFCHEIGNFCEGDMEHWPHDCLIEFGEEVAHYCLENDDSGCEALVEICDDASGVNETVCESYEAFNHDAYHGNEGMPTLNGFQGIVEPHDWQDDMTFMHRYQVTAPNVDSTTASPISIGTNFTLHFDEEIEDPYFFERLPVGAHSFHCSSTVGGEPDTEIDFSLVNNGDEDCGDGADEPQDTDGDGETDNWFDCHDGSQVSMDVVNDGVDDCLDGEDEGHHGSDIGMLVTFVLLEDYEVIECIGCEDYDDDVWGYDNAIQFYVTNANFRIHFDYVSDIIECPENASGAPVCVCDAGFDGNLTFDDDDGWSGTCVVIEEEPEPEPTPVLPDCDVTIGMDDANYAFDPVSVEIDFGQTVCWQWTNSTEAHNVAQVAESSDTTKLSSGFYSGAANVSGDFRVTFDSANGYSDDTSYYYICEPHATMGMIGEIVVGTGSTDEELEEALEESDLPSVSFIVGILVLVGAAGLRRRIH